MIKFKVQGELDELEFTENLSQPYKWDSLEQLVKIISYCFLHTCNQQKDTLQKFSRQQQIKFVDALKIKIQKELQYAPWDCAKYLFYPEGEKIPTQQSQNKMIQRYFSVLLKFLQDQHKLMNYLEYQSNFVENQLIDLDNYELWNSKLNKDDFTMLKNIFISINTVSYTYYEYILRRYKLNPVPGQLDQYTKIKTEFATQFLFSGIYVKKQHENNDNCGNGGNGEDGEDDE